jgi:riboflavin synthase
MFTGLIAETGTVVSLTPTAGATRIVVTAPTLAARLNTGDSIAVSGVCLTALDITGTTFAADLATETIERTSLSRLAPGTVINLELPTPAGTPLGGHIVQGHVDAVGHLTALTPLHPNAKDATDWKLAITLPASLRPLVVEKGSITIEGISLTVASVTADGITVAIIPHTYKATNLHTLKPGSEVNLEADVLARYAAARALSHGEETITEFSLIAEGY